ncbi:MAG: hypothetical protein JSS69_01105 [Acidobacteria bacterium]|nr:hypothetical protein [Acidobacteriota bacterium]MBS1864491.1 hypothetical protein [Acidobacteriota bacterium]
MSTKTMIPIWFFAGWLLAVYGALILVAGLWAPTSDTQGVAMQGMHLQIWWGIGLLALGLVYGICFWPRHPK